MPLQLMYFLFFFFNDTATTEIYTLSLHDALPILNRNRKPIAKSIGASSVIEPFHIVATQLKTFTPVGTAKGSMTLRSEEHTSELQSHSDLVCRLLLEKKQIHIVDDRDVRIRARSA